MSRHDGGLNWERYGIYRDGKIVNLDKRYFVLNIDEDPCAKIALMAYANAVKKDNPELSRDILEIKFSRYPFIS